MVAADPSSTTVLHVSQPGDGGVAACVGHLAADQVARGWRVVAAVPGGSDLETLVRDTGALAVEWEARRSPGPQVGAETQRLRRAIELHRPDLVHLHSSKAGLAGRIALRGRIPTVFQPHSWSFEAVDGATRRAALAWERLATRWTDALLCVSEGERQRGRAHGIEAQYRVIPNGVDRREFAVADDEARSRARVALGLPPTPVVVCVGRLCRQKGQDRLVALWPGVRERVPDATLVLVGSGEDEEQLRAEAGGGVVFAGQRTDVPTWYAAADVVVLPSRWEGMALGLLEAMATGRSIVATDVGGAREALGDDAGAVVRVLDDEELSRAVVERLLSPDLRSAEERAAAERAGKYDLRVTLDRTAQLYEELVRLPRAATST